jgi:hypothetical protein
MQLLRTANILTLVRITIYARKTVTEDKLWKYFQAVVT